MHPILFQIGDFIVPTYGAMIALGVIACVWTALRRARTLGISEDSIYDLGFWAVASGFVGARVLYIILNFGEFLDSPLSVLFSRSGFVFLGGLAGAIPMVFWYIHRHKLKTWEIGDIGGPSIALAHAFGRIGCFLAGCCYGGICPKDSSFSFLGVQYPVLRDPKTGEILFSWAYQDHLERHLIGSEATHSLAVYPSQLIESAALFLIFGALMLLWRRRKFSGQIFASYLMMYGIARFLLEFLRGDAARGIWFGFSTSQWLGIVAVVAGVIIWIVQSRLGALDSPPAIETQKNEKKTSRNPKIRGSET